VARSPEQIKRYDGPLASLPASSSLQAPFGCLPRLSSRACRGAPLWEREERRDTAMTVIAACQLALAIGDLAGNARAAESAVHNAAARGAQFVVLPELSDTGYVLTGPAEARALAAPALYASARQRSPIAGSPAAVLVRRPLVCLPSHDGAAQRKKRPGQIVRRSLGVMSL
jgi:hypothetical protein